MRAASGAINQPSWGKDQKVQFPIYLLFLSHPVMGTMTDRPPTLRPYQRSAINGLLRTLLQSPFSSSLCLSGRLPPVQPPLPRRGAPSGGLRGQAQVPPGTGTRQRPVLHPTGTYILISTLESLCVHFNILLLHMYTTACQDRGRPSGSRRVPVPRGRVSQGEDHHKGDCGTAGKAVK